VIVGLAILLPLFLAIAALIKLDSPGPVFFWQERVGRGGKIFRILKFRSMERDSLKKGLQITVANDQRITRMGRSLRKYKLDELPQLLNVLNGDMSLVGPRPETPRYVALYPEEARGVVLSVRPGITDEASIEFSDEGSLLAQVEDPEWTYIHEIMPRKIAIYERYVANQNVLGDLRIIMRTLKRILSQTIVAR